MIHFCYLLTFLYKMKQKRVNFVYFKAFIVVEEEEIVFVHIFVTHQTVLMKTSIRILCLTRLD